VVEKRLAQERATRKERGMLGWIWAKYGIKTDNTLPTILHSPIAVH